MVAIPIIPAWRIEIKSRAIASFLGKRIPASIQGVGTRNLLTKGARHHQAPGQMVEFWRVRYSHIRSISQFLANLNFHNLVNEPQRSSRKTSTKGFLDPCTVHGATKSMDVLNGKIFTGNQSFYHRVSCRFSPKAIAEPWDIEVPPVRKTLM